MLKTSIQLKKLRIQVINKHNTLYIGIDWRIEKKSGGNGHLVCAQIFPKGFPSFQIICDIDRCHICILFTLK